MSTRVIVSSPFPDCDLDTTHGVAYADAHIPGAGAWGYVCFECFHARRCELGTGRGQILITRDQAR